MEALSPQLRRQLERVVADAREVAETGARAALEALAVSHAEAFEHMGAEERNLRRRLRAHGRQLGDRRDPHSGGQGIDRLVHECAYEHWHGMLFARFLAENHLLIEPEMAVAVSLEDCEELGKEAGVDKWMVAARFAHEMLPQVFRPDHPVFEIRLAREHWLKLEGLVESLPAEIFLARDSLGWVYQFWQSRKKDEVNRSGSKIGADELPAVTQLFTEPYMVSFLLDNSLGAWWAARRLSEFDLSESDLSEASSETELRRKAAIPGMPLEYIRFVRIPRSASKTGEARRDPNGEIAGTHPPASLHTGLPTAGRSLPSPSAKSLPSPSAKSLPSSSAKSLPSSSAKSLPSPSAKSLPSPSAKSLPSSSAKSLPSSSAKSLPSSSAKSLPSPSAKSLPSSSAKSLPSSSAKSLPSPSGRGAGGEGKRTRIPARILEYARDLRSNHTDAEQLLWGLLRSRRFAGKKFRRQHPIGRYILDFYCHESKLAVELDGGQHNDGETKLRDDQGHFLFSSAERFHGSGRYPIESDMENV